MHVARGAGVASSSVGIKRPSRLDGCVPQRSLRQSCRCQPN